MDLKVIEGNLLDSPEQYICHQCNCLTTHSAGIAHSIFLTFPWSNIYIERESPEIKHHLDEIHIRGNGQEFRFVINMMAQYYPGTARYPDSAKDGIERRKKAFQECLGKISGIADLKSIAFPWKIGCNLAGGDWNEYRHMIREFADANPNLKVRVYRLPGAE